MEAAIISAISALAGVALSQGFATLHAHLAARRARTRLLRAKLEELAEQLHLASLWVDGLLRQAESTSGAKSGGSPRPLQPSAECRRVYVLALIYFPDLHKQASIFLQSADRFYHAIEAGNKDSLIEASQTFASSRKALDELIAAQAKHLL